MQRGTTEIKLSYGAKFVPNNATVPPAVVKEITTNYGATFIPNNASPAQIKSTPQPVKQTLPQIRKPAPKTSPVENLRREVDGRTLTVGGVRVIKNFSAEEPPWVDNQRDILNIVIENGVEEISAHAFENCKRLEQVTFPASVKTIGDFAFTICYCGDKRIDGGRNVFWTLDNGTLMLKKNPAAKVDSDFSTGFVMWRDIERNIMGFELEDGVVPREKFLTWLARRTAGKKFSFD